MRIVHSSHLFTAIQGSFRWGTRRRALAQLDWAPPGVCALRAGVSSSHSSTEARPHRRPPPPIRRSGGPIWPRFFGTLVLVWATCSAGCTSPCADLRDHARQCGTAASRYVDPDDSVCARTRASFQGDDFAAYAVCVAQSPCDDRDAIDGCIAAHTASEPSACERFKLWASACGLEPRGTENNCEALSASAALPDGVTAEDNMLFADWVACITRDGCPEREDARYAQCQQEVAPGGPAQAVDACAQLTEWGDACGEDLNPMTAQFAESLPTCLALATDFTSVSFGAYASCISDTNCADAVAQLQCTQQLETIDPTAAAAACAELADYSSQCGAEPPGGSEQACTELLARATEESINTYVECVTDAGCGNAQAAVTCLDTLSFN